MKPTEHTAKYKKGDVYVAIESAYFDINEGHRYIVTEDSNDDLYLMSYIWKDQFLKDGLIKPLGAFSAKYFRYSHSLPTEPEQPDSEAWEDEFDELLARELSIVKTDKHYYQETDESIYQVTDEVWGVKNFIRTLVKKEFDRGRNWASKFQTVVDDANKMQLDTLLANERERCAGKISNLRYWQDNKPYHQGYDQAITDAIQAIRAKEDTP